MTTFEIVKSGKIWAVVANADGKRFALALFANSWEAGQHVKWARAEEAKMERLNASLAAVKALQDAQS